jgi:hypothetical protein
MNDNLANSRRDTFEAIQTMLKGIKREGLVVTPSELQFSLPITNNESSYDFPILRSDVGKDTIIKTDVYLNKNDTFVCTHLAYGWRKRNIVNKDEGYQYLRTFKDITDLTPSAVFDPEQLEALYNAQVTMTVGSSNLAEKIPTRMFKYAPEAQAGANPVSQYDYITPAIPLGATWLLYGDDEVNFNVKLPSSVENKWATDVANEELRLTLIPIGFLIKGDSNQSVSITTALERKTL